MSSHLYGGNHRPPHRTTTAAILLPISHNSHNSHILPQALNPVPRSLPQHIHFEYNLGSSRSQEGFEPASKRRKLDATPIKSQQSHEISSNLPPQPVLTAVVDVPSVQVDHGELLSSSSLSHVPCFPARPKYRASWTVQTSPLRLKPTPKETVQAKPYLLEIPKSAPYYEDKLPADFFPWKGLHQEDILNEQSTKSGYFDRVQVASIETNAARPSVWSGLKHKSGLQILSSLFGSVLDKRQAYGTVTTKCTFKPPPRVTLTDTKREAWLRDLANPAIPLRRLSRTIPHGVRGKVLLEQCLAKKIPTWRAVWLAKCVGANEIRASKRKGTSGAFSIGGESKWIKDWTLNVEQFVDFLVSSCGVPEWGSNIIYGLRLMVHIHAEHLVDAEHFFEWMVASFRSSQPESLPIWILVVEIYVEEIRRFRYRGQRLAAALLEHLKKVMLPEQQEISVSISRSIADLVKALALSEPVLFLRPSCWLDYEPALSLCLDKRDPNLKSCFEQIRSRNVHLLGQSPTNMVEQSPREIFIAILDEMDLELDVSTLSDTACAAISDPNLLICTLIEWAATVYRQGLPRVYVALRLLRHWSIAGFDLDRPVMQFISHFSSTAGLAVLTVYKLVAELIRSRLLSVTKYLQWIMARGPDHNITEIDTVETFALELLNHIPVDGLPPHVMSLRQILLETSGLFDSEAQIKEAGVKMSISSTVKILRHENSPFGAPYQVDNLACLSGTIKYGISRWIKLNIATELENSKHEGANCAGKEPQTIFMTMGDFQAIRNMLESLGDYPTLADVLAMIVVTGHRHLSYLVAETVNCHIDIFLALGAAESLFKKILSCLKLFYIRGPADKPILISLLDIGERVSSLSHTLRPLREELTLCECKTPIAACSPVSDYMAEALHPSNATFLDHAELFFNSGSSMDRKTFSKTFSNITKSLQLEVLNDMTSLHDFMELLAQLRSFDEESFGTLLLLWIEDLLWLGHQPQLIAIMIHLVCANLLDLACVLRKVCPRLKDDKDQDHRAMLALRILSILVARTSVSGYDDTMRVYRLQRAKDTVFHSCLDALVFAIQYCLEGLSSQDLLTRQSAIDMTDSEDFLQLFQLVILRHQSISQDLGNVLRLEALRTTASTILDRLLGFPLSLGQSSWTVETELRHILHLANDFNINICRLKLGLILSERQGGLLDAKDADNKSVSILVWEAASSFRSRPGIFAGLLRSLPQGYAEVFRELSVSKLLACMPDWSLEVPTISGESAEQSDTCEGLIACIEVVECQIPRDRGFEFIVELLQRILTVLRAPQLARLHTDHALHDNADLPGEVEHTGRLTRVCKWFAILLRLLVIHQGILVHAKFPQQTLCRLLLSLALILVNPKLVRHYPSPNFLFDIAALVTDSLSSESRLYCVTLLCEQHNIRDSRLEYLLGSPDQEQNELLLHVAGTGITSHSFAADSLNRVRFSLRRWEMVQDATPIVGENDTSLSLSLFGTRKAVS